MRRITCQRLRPVLWSLLLAAAATGSGAAPVDREQRPLTSATPAVRPGTGDTAADKAFRDGVQAQLKGNWAGAKSHFEEALRGDPTHGPSLIGMAGVAQAQGLLPDAQAWLMRAEKAHPQAPEVHLAWGRFHIARNDLAKAQTALLKARSLAPKSLPVLIELGDLYMRTGRADDSLKVFREATALDPKNKFAVFGRGTAAAMAGSRTEAQTAFESAAKLAPQDPAPLRSLGRLHLEAGAIDKALASFSTGLQRQPKFVPLMLDRADALGRAKRWPEATEQAQAAERAEPASPEVLLAVGDIHQGAGRWADAEARYLKVIELAPKHPAAYNNLAWMTVTRKGDAAKAVAWAKQAVQLSPNSSPFHDTLGWAQRAAGDLAGAQASLNQAIKLEGNVATFHYHLGVVLAEQRSAAPARDALQKALQLDPKLPQADDARRLLASLPPG